MYTDIPGQIKNTMKDKLKKKDGGGPKPRHKLTKIITFKEKVLKVLI